jgi:hypothetical protein
MRRSLHSAPRAATLTAALLLLPTAAHAQFGGLKRRLEAEVGRAVLGEAPSKAQSAPTFNDRVLEITDARLAQLVVGLRAEVAATESAKQAQAATNARAAEHDKALAAYDRCIEPYRKELLRYTGMTMGLALAAKREQGKTGQAGGPMQDSLKAVTTRMAKVGEDLHAKCGEGPGPSPYETMSDESGSDPEAQGARAAKLGGDQYAVLRERVAAYLQARGRGTGSYVYGAGERAALDARAGELAGFRKQLLGS